MTIVIAYPYKFIAHYYHLYEVDFLMRFSDVLVWDMGMLCHPKFTKAIAAPSAEHSCVRRVDGWRDLARALKELRARRGKGDKVVVLLPPQFTSFRALICSGLIKLLAHTIVDFYVPGVPSVDDAPAAVHVRHGGWRGVASLTRLIRDIRDREFLRSYRMVWWMAIRALASLLRIRPTHRLMAGRVVEERHKIRWQNAGIQVVAASMWDFSNSLADAGIGERPLVAGRYAVLLDGAGPAYTSDAVVMGSRTILTSDKWYPALSAWFEQLERETGVKIVVAGNPKSTLPQNPKEFGFRRVYYGCTEQLVKHSDFVITRGSTAVSFAVIYHKPVLCIYNDQIKSNRACFLELCKYAQVLGVRPINLDAPPSCTEEYLRVPQEAHARYKADYLTSLNSPKPNYRVIAEDILGVSAATRC